MDIINLGQNYLIYQSLSFFISSRLMIGGVESFSSIDFKLVEF